MLKKNIDFDDKNKTVIKYWHHQPKARRKKNTFLSIKLKNLTECRKYMLEINIIIVSTLKKTL